jgi:beta-phosphoglucomutase
MNGIGLIFDLDGVLVDTAKFHYIAWKACARTLNIDFSLEQNEELKGVSRVESLKKILSWGNQKIDDIKFNRLLEEKNAHYLSLVDQMTESDTLKGVPEFLESARKAGFAIALGSASRNAEMILKKTGLFDYFESIIDGNRVTRSKPNPEVFLKGAIELGIDPGNCVVFEDSISGIQAAKTGGMKAIGIGKVSNLSQADVVWSGLDEHHPNEIL